MTKSKTWQVRYLSVKDGDHTITVTNDQPISYSQALKEAGKFFLRVGWRGDRIIYAEPIDKETSRLQ